MTFQSSCIKTSIWTESIGVFSFMSWYRSEDAHLWSSRVFSVTNVEAILCGTNFFYTHRFHQLNTFISKNIVSLLYADGNYIPRLYIAISLTLRAWGSCLAFFHVCCFKQKLCVVQSLTKGKYLSSNFDENISAFIILTIWKLSLLANKREKLLQRTGVMTVAL